MKQENSKAEELLEQGISYSENNEYEKALPYFKQAAELGLLEAQCMYIIDLLVISEESGKDFSSEVKKYVNLIRNAANQGDPDGQACLAMLYEEGFGVSEDMKTAVKWYQKAANQGNAGAQSKLGECYYLGKGVAENDAKAVKWFQKSADQGNADAQYYLGECYYLGKGVAGNDAEAVKWFQKAAEQGNADAQWQLGHCYYFGNGVLKNEQKAASFYQKAANQGHAKAQYLLGNCYQFGCGVKKDFRKAIEWYKKSIDNGYDELDVYDSISFDFLNIIWKMRENGTNFQKIVNSKELAEGIQYAEYAINHFDCENAEDGTIYVALAELYRYKNLDRALDYAEYAVALGVEDADETLQDLRSVNGTFGNIGRFLSGIFD